MPRSRSSARAWPSIGLAALGTFLATLALTAGLSTAAYFSHEHTESRLLKLKVAEAGLVLQAALPTLQTPLTAAAEFATGTPAEATAAFRTFIKTYVGAQPAPFVAAALFDLTDLTDPAHPRLLTTDGAALQIPPASAGALVAQAKRDTGVAVIGLLGATSPRIGYAYTLAGGNPHYAVYAESSVPAGHRVVPQSSGPFSDLRIRLYLGKTIAPRALIEQTADRLGHPRSKAVVPFGDTALTLVASSRGPLAGGLPAALWWITIVGGGVLALAVGAVTEWLVRRRKAADRLSRDVSALLATQVAISRRLQRALIPTPPGPIEGVEIAVRYVAGADDVDLGGDWYDAQAVDGQVYCTIGDVSGRGIEAGTIMASLRSAVRAYVTEGHRPGGVLSRLDTLLDAGNRHFATVCCAALDVRTGRLVVSNAGHLPPLLCDSEQSRYLEVDPGPPIGAIGAATAYQEQAFHLPRGSWVIFYTDGLVERRGEVIDDGLERLRQSVVAHFADGTGMLEGIVADLHQQTSEDDTAIMAVRWVG